MDYYSSELDDNYLYQSLEKLIDYPMSLEYKYNIRSYIYAHNITPENDSEGILPLATSGHTWYFKNINNILKDKSLAIITNLCSGATKKNGHVSDEIVMLLSKIFNNTVLSERPLIDCYDCGTTARAVFLSLVHINRRKILLYPYEIKRMQNMYSDAQIVGYIRIKECYHFLKNLKQSSVIICSIGLNLSGHVFILEKKCQSSFNERYHIYQSCLNSYTLLDYIEQQDYINNKSINIDIFFECLLKLYRCKIWGYNENLIFTELFSYLPHHEINSISKEFDFLWTYITYNEDK